MNLDTHPVRAIYVIGPSSTGKTTLCNAVASALRLAREAHVKEVARTIMKETGFSRRDISALAMQETILAAQIQREKEAWKYVEEDAAEPQLRVLLADRSAIDPIVYACLTAQTADEAQKRKAALLARQDLVAEALPRYKAATTRIFLLRPVEGWLIDDGIRSLEDQAKCFQAFEDILAELEIDYQMLGEEMKDIEERVSVVLRCIEELDVTSTSST